MEKHPVVIIGAGPAGLTSAYQLVKQGIKPIVLEKADKVGGIARTEIYKGYRFDIGGHRFYTKVEEVQKLWQEVLGEDFLKVPRMSRIYYRNRFFNYPLSIFNTLSNIGIIESLLILLSYFKAQLWPCPQEDTLDQWVTNRFGSRLYKIFFKTYTEKVWGIPCNKIQAEWAAQRIKGLSLKTAILNALFGSNDTKTLIKEFDYPALGPGMMWEKFQEAVDSKGGQVCLNTGVIRIEREGNHINKIIAQKDGETFQIAGENFISTMPVTTLIDRLDPPAPDEVIQAAKSLNYRNFIIVSLIIDAKDLFPDNWIYVHSSEVKVGRIQNFKNWSPEMVPDANKTCLGMEYFCSYGDEIWTMSDSELLDLATTEIARLGLAEANKVEDGVVLRQAKAYPVYDRDYRQHLQVIQKYLENFDNLQTIGRNGMHRYNNQDHSMLTGMLAVRNLLGENNDLWEVNTERSYYEEFTKDDLKNQKALQVLETKS
ncbi:NAD(P)/FAD-dependent oxidoreductase [Cylindrospermum sp. FACHB-282]|uniref:NAD(P)/FAD-dependent oxidoreductase n=1 Tax=Cylindrospermum sp. FACHB-282 TaxID=2692794 RepID=UPI00168598C2|nr:NAD(P)/FAD-dependent oxidoreductase [Cylindrospermum sp. FACHB-282]MBD2387211.1 NAD(P)/FAD-dependent oxidoreductase [Cylindrospermum sp. FACHB-282]